MDKNEKINTGNVADDAEIHPNEIANVDIQCHLVIRDLDTTEVLVNQRG